ncbi:Uncharacterized conserved protein, DUF305 family [Asanoa hainanensis]|uniref:Uncharacterized conserved protein, DUF305 family n=1 Tax=Asanoa hainanensis TaxID=560556 RepID=A0A239M3Z8_9ACTN|nr:DUF305 domain-containing protein [Asanoa hainanensis]SNT37385.1 Uncharacterized conserved protein, DUF305 family [Asanoa hainanensis]
MVDDDVPSNSRPRHLVLIALAVLLAVLAGGVGGWLLAQDGHDDASVEAGFARDMSSHHAQAVEMGMLAHSRSDDPDVRTLGGDIALTQHGQIGIMQTWLRDWDLLPTGEQPRMAWMNHEGHAADGPMPGMASQEEMTRLRAASGRDFDVLFGQLMLRHHLGGIAMAEAALAQSDDEDVRWLAESMKSGQQSELGALTQLLDRKGAKPL